MFEIIRVNRSSAYFSKNRTKNVIKNQGWGRYTNNLFQNYLKMVDIEKLDYNILAIKKLPSENPINRN